MKQDKKRPLIAALPDFGKVPPQSIDTEEAVLNIVLMESDTINDVADFLTSEMFYKEAHKIIYETCLELHKKSGKADVVMVSNELRNKQQLESVGGPVYLSQLTCKYYHSAMLERYAMIVKQKWVAREYIRIGTELQTRGFDDSYDIIEIAEYAETSLLELSGRIIKKKAKKLKVIINEEIERISKVKSGEVKLIGIPSGFTKFDRATGGFKKKELAILGARPSMGKTALALQIAKNASGLGYPTGLFSLEMGEEELGRKYISGESGNTNMELVNGKCEIDHLYNSSTPLTTLPLYIDDTSTMTLLEMRAKVRRMIIEYGIVLVVVDYLQLMTGTGNNREQEVASVSRGLKAMAKDFDVAVLALAQLGRGVDKVADKRPTLSDLRESGAIEQDADMVGFIFRPAYYKMPTIIIGNEEKDSKGVMLVDFAKNRNGALMEIELKHNICFSQITEPDESPSFTSFESAMKDIPATSFERNTDINPNRAFESMSKEEPTF